MKNILLALGMLVLSSAVAAGPADDVLADLKETAASGSYYWCWTQPWLPSREFHYGDARYAVEKEGKLVPGPIEQVVFDGPETSLTKVRCRFFLDEMARMTGTWKTDAYYAANRASQAAIIRRAWKDFRGVCVFTWHNDNPCCTNGFKRGPLRFRCRAHPNVFRGIVRGEKWPCGRETAKRGVCRKPFESPRAWFLHELADIADFLSTLVDEEGRRIPVVLRYPHEMDGGWFWWGKGHCEPEDYVGVCRLMADELRARGAAGQVLFAYTPDKRWPEMGKEGDNQNNYLSWYPGDAYVDIVGFDDYSIGFGATAAECDQRNEETLRKMRALTRFADGRGKVAVISETGWANVSWSRHPAQDDFYTRLNRLMTADGVKFAAVATWHTHRTIPDTEAGRADMLAFAKLPNVKLIRRK